MLGLEQLAELLEKNRAAARTRVSEFSIGGQPFAFNSRPAIMGVINLSADSWYRESVCLSADRAIERGKVLQAQGADIVDIGAESSLAHAARLDDTAQNRRLLPVIQTLAASGVPVSVDSLGVASRTVDLVPGNNTIRVTANDLWGNSGYKDFLIKYNMN